MEIEINWKRVEQILNLCTVLAVASAIAGTYAEVTHRVWWLPTLFYSVLFVTGSVYFFLRFAQHEALTQQQQDRLGKLEEKALQEPEKASYAWDLARAKLEAYFDRNLSQVKAIFWMAVVVMVAGFGFIVWGLQKAIATPEHVTIAIIGAASGIITQFIGLTFMAIYKNTMEQATRYVSVLERINTVGMAVQILDAIDEQSSELKDVTRVDIIRLLLAPASTNLSFSPRTRKKKPGDKPDVGSEAPSP